ncbi:MAG TPA: MFS transporter, partial [Gaiellaceae bacterium]|nr:MFS transporter [Gaiellaceae bacterium]
MSGTRSSGRPLAAFLAFGTFWGGWAVLVPQVQAAIGASKGALGLALLAVGAGSVPAMLAVRRLLDRHAHRLTPLAFAVMAGTVLLPGAAGSVAALAAALLAVGACSGVADVAINAEIAAIEAERERPLMGLAHGLYSVGVMVGAVTSGLLRQAGLERVPILAVFAACLLAAAVANRSRPPHPRAPAALPRARIALPLILIGTACAVAFVVESGIETWSALFLQRDLGAGPAASSAGPAAFGAAMASGRLLGHRLTRSLADRVLLTGGGALAAAGLLVAAVAQSLPLAATGC